MWGESFPYGDNRPVGETVMAKRGRKIDTTTDSGGDRRRPDPARVKERERAVTGEDSSGDRTAGREEGPKEPVRGMRVGETEVGPTND
jgi:hypothetical protein